MEETGSICRILRVTVLLRDEAFGRALVQGLAGLGQRMEFQALSFSEASFLAETVKSGHGAPDLILLDAADVRQVPEQLRTSDRVVFLTEEPERCGPDTIYRYTDARTMRDLLFGFYCARTRSRQTFAAASELRAAVFFGLSGGAGATTTALASAGLLHRLYGARTLYIPGTVDNGSERYLSPGECLARRFLFDVKSGRDPDIRPYLVRDELVDHFGVAGRSCFAGDLDGDIWHGLLRAAECEGSFRYLFLDLGTDFSRRNLEIAGSADAVVVVGRGKYGVRTSHEKELEALVERCCGAKRLISVDNRSRGENILLREDLPADERGERIAIRDEPRAFSRMGGSIRIELETAYGLEMTRAAKRIAEVCGHADGGGTLS